jgi:hypothetical protein
MTSARTEVVLSLINIGRAPGGGWQIHCRPLLELHLPTSDSKSQPPLITPAESE